MDPSRGPADEVAARLAAIVASSDDAIISKTVEGVITSWNRGAERLFGYTAAEAVGQHITLIIPPERHDEERTVLAHIVRGESLDHFETVRVRKDGSLVEISLTVSPVKNAAGVIVGASKIARDITDRKRIEEERAILLERERVAREAAEVANRSKDEFLATLSHELRTPLNAIFGWARLLQAGQLEPAVAKQAIEAILRNATAQVQLIEELLDVSRIISGKMKLDVQPIDLKRVIEAALDAVRPAADAKQVSLRADLADDRSTAVIGAADRLQQVAWNLLVNAVKFTPRNGRVEIRLSRVRSHVEIVVSDTGEGIGPDVLPHVFERFRQGDSSSTRAHGGLGLGLALVRHIVDLHGGSVRAESEGIGRGATFTVSLPVAIVATAAATGGPDAVEGTPRSAQRSQLERIRVLVVDDDPDGLEIAAVILSKSGADVRTCTSARAALEVLASWQPDVLISDIEMPGEDGYALLRSARALGTATGYRMRAVALTAYGRAEDRERTLAAGFNLHLDKPVDPEELVIAVANLAGKLE